MTNAQNDVDLQGLFVIADLEALLLETGYSKPLSLVCMEDKNSIVSSVTDYHCLIKVKAAMDQFMEGLNSGGVLEYIKKYPNIMRPLFCPRPSDLPAGEI